MRGVRRPLVAVALFLSSASPFTLGSGPVCGVGLYSAPMTCAEKLRRCVFEEKRTTGDCFREFVACLGPWEGPYP